MQKIKKHFKKRGKMRNFKGCSLIGMLSELLGKNGFRDGLRDYVAKYQYKNAEGDDLWDSLEPVAL